MSDLSERKEAALAARLQKIGIGAIQKHILFCDGEKCCLSNDEDLWNFLKGRIAELKLNEKGVFRTKVKCLRVCQQGAVAVVYPEGVWYANLNRERLEQVITSHLRDGIPVEDLVIARNPLPS